MKSKSKLLFNENSTDLALHSHNIFGLLLYHRLQINAVEPADIYWSENEREKTEDE